MNLPPAIAKLAHNKAAMAGLGGAVLLGVVVHSRNKSTPTSSKSATAGNTSGSAAPGSDGSGVATTYPNTAPTDLATAVGNLDSKYADQVKTFQGQLGTDEAALTALQTSETGLAGAVASLKPSKSTYTVKKGDTQVAIAKRYGTTVHALEALNPAIQPKGSQVKTGMKLLLPG